MSVTDREKETTTSNISSKPEMPFMVDFFKELYESNIEYCVLRNYDKLPYDLNGSDLDILLSSQDTLERARQIVVATAYNHKGFAVWREWHDCLCIVVCSGFDKNNNRWGLRVDLFSSIRWKGFNYYPCKKVLYESCYKDGVRIADSFDANLIGLIDKLLHGGFVRHKYFKATTAANKQFANKTKDRLTEIFGNHGKLFIAALDTGDSFTLKYLTKKLRRYLLKRGIIISPLKTLTNKIIRLRVHCCRLWKRPGIIVAVLGPDGSGKSTLIENVRIKLNRILHVETELYQFRPWLLPPLAVLFGQSSQETGPLINPHSKPPSGSFLSIFRLAYYTLDFVFGFWLIVYPKLVRLPGVIMFDRYFYDFFFDPARFRVRLPRWIVSVFSLVIPQPDLILLLKVQPEIAASRKKELPLEEIHRQLESMKYLGRKLKCVKWIDTSEPIEDCKKIMLDTIIGKFEGHPGWK